MKTVTSKPKLQLERPLSLMIFNFPLFDKFNYLLINFFGNSIQSQSKSTQNAPKPIPLYLRALRPSISLGSEPLVREWYFQ